MPGSANMKRVVSCMIVVAAWSLSGCAAPGQVGGGTGPRVNTIGAATMVENGIRLVPAQNKATGAAWFTDKQSVSGGFDATFAFQITQCDKALNGGDGFAFVIQNCEANAMSGPGGGMGYGGYGRPYDQFGIPGSLAVEFDTYANPSEPNGNHISVQTRGKERNRAEQKYSIGTATEIPNLEDGKLHSVNISYRQPGTLSVYIDQSFKPALVVTVDLDKTLGLSAGRAWVGFTAATAIAYEDIRILSWSFKPVGR